MTLFGQEMRGDGMLCHDGWQSIHAVFGEALLCLDRPSKHAEFNLQTAPCGLWRGILQERHVDLRNSSRSKQLVYIPETWSKTWDLPALVSLRSCARGVQVMYIFIKPY